MMTTNRTINSNARIEDALSHLRDEDLAKDVELFHRAVLPDAEYDRLLRAAKVAKNGKAYEDISHGRREANLPGLVHLSGEEMKALRDEKASFFSNRGMLVVVFTVTLAAFLQGHVQSSMNATALYRDVIGIPSSEIPDPSTIARPRAPTAADTNLAFVTATPFLAAGALGCLIASPISDRFGRRGAMAWAASLIIVTSVLQAVVLIMSNPSVPLWILMIIIRIFNGIGMGIKAVNSAIMASESAIGYWRGTSILGWQLWVALGLAIGFSLNLLFSLSENRTVALACILGSPIIPACMLLEALAFCPESPRFYLRRGPHYNPPEAYRILKSLRKCELIAMRDMYVLHKSIEQEHNTLLSPTEFVAYMRCDQYIGLSGFWCQFRELLMDRRNRNALISSSVVCLCQQLCGINILAFYSGFLFVEIAGERTSLYLSMGFGFTNFIFGLPAFKSIDRIGRRRLLTRTLPFMSLAMMGAALSYVPFEYSKDTTIVLLTFFLYVHAAFYSPGLGPVPFTLAAESFPLSHRELGASLAIAVNLFFAGLLSILFPIIVSWLGSAGCFGVFAVLNAVAFALVFLFVEETAQLSLEDLDFVFAVSKRDFYRFQLYERLPWLIYNYIPWMIRHFAPWVVFCLIPWTLQYASSWIKQWYYLGRQFDDFILPEYPLLFLREEELKEPPELYTVQENETEKDRMSADGLTEETVTENVTEIV